MSNFCYRFVFIVVYVPRLYATLICKVTGEQLCKTRRAIGDSDDTQMPQVVQSVQNQAENLMIGLIRDFAQTQNVSSITACLPIPKSAEDPVQWGIISTTLPEVNKTGKIVCESHTKIEQVPIEQRTKELVKNAMIKRGDCLKLPGAEFVKI